MQTAHERNRKNNETHISTRLDRAALDVFDSIIREVGAAARKRGQPIPTRASVTRAAVRYMMRTWSKDREGWIADIIAELPPAVVDNAS